MSRKSCNKRRSIKKKRCIKKHTYKKKTFTKKQKRIHLRGGVNRIEENEEMHETSTLKFANGNTYKGELVNGKMHGTGTLKFAKGNTYEGKFKNGKIDGIGTLTFPGVGKFTGEFINGKIDENYTENIFELNDGRKLKDTDCEFGDNYSEECEYLEPFMKD